MLLGGVLCVVGDAAAEHPHPWGHARMPAVCMAAGMLQHSGNAACTTPGCVVEAASGYRGAVVMCTCWSEGSWGRDACVRGFCLPLAHVMCYCQRCSCAGAAAHTLCYLVCMQGRGGTLLGLSASRLHVCRTYPLIRMTIGRAGWCGHICPSRAPCCAPRQDLPCTLCVDGGG